MYRVSIDEELTMFDNPEQIMRFGELNIKSDTVGLTREEYDEFISLLEISENNIKRYEEKAEGNKLKIQ